MFPFVKESLHSTLSLCLAAMVKVADLVEKHLAEILTRWGRGVANPPLSGGISTMKPRNLTPPVQDHRRKSLSVLAAGVMKLAGFRVHEEAKRFYPDRIAGGHCDH